MWAPSNDYKLSGGSCCHFPAHHRINWLGVTSDLKSQAENVAESVHIRVCEERYSIVEFTFCVNKVTG
jgi:hypothetical protein